jgi:hypothetical protein
VNVSTGGGGGTPDDPLEPLWFPNPTDNKLTVEIQPGDRELSSQTETNRQNRQVSRYNYYLYDLNHQLVRQFETDKRKVQINTSDLEDGFYILHVVGGDKVYRAKIEVRH